jgi:phosphoenolpyruvate carboxylase
MNDEPLGPQNETMTDSNVPLRTANMSDEAMPEEREMPYRDILKAIEQIISNIDSKTKAFQSRDVERNDQSGKSETGTHFGDRLNKIRELLEDIDVKLPF